MTEDIPQLVSAISPYVTAAVAAYGTAVLEKATDHSAEAGVTWGRKMLRRVFGTREEPDVPGPIRDLADRPDDSDLLRTVRSLIVEAMQRDDVLLSDIRNLLIAATREVLPPSSSSVTASAADRAQQVVQGHGFQMNVFHGPSD